MPRSASAPRGRRAVAAAAVVVALTLPAGCSAGASDGGDSLHVGLVAAPANLDYTRSGGVAIPQALLYNVYETLMGIDGEGNIVPLLATGYEVDDAGLTYTFTLESGVRFSNGDALTSSDVRYSVERILAGDWTANSPALVTDVVDSVETPSDTKVVFHLKRPSNNWLFTMAGPLGTVFSEDVDPATYATETVGSGPYSVTGYAVGKTLSLAANGEYRGDAAAIPEVELRYYADAATQTNALRADDVDFAFRLSSTESVAGFREDARFQVQEGTTTGEVMLAMNNAEGPLADLRVRQAINYGIDRQRVMDQTTDGYGTLIGSMVPPSDPWYDASLADRYPFDPDRARQLLAEAGVEGATLRLRVPTLPYAQTAARDVQTQLADIGLDVVIDELEFPAVWLQEVFSAQGPHDYDLSIIEHSEPRDIFTIVQPGYYLGIQDPSIRERIDAADQGPADEFAPGMAEAARMLADDAVADWLWLTTAVSVADADLQGLPVNVTSYSLDLTGVHR